RCSTRSATAPGSRRCCGPSSRSRAPRERLSTSRRSTLPFTTSAASARKGARPATPRSRSCARCASAPATPCTAARRARTSSTPPRCSSRATPSSSASASSTGCAPNAHGSRRSIARRRWPRARCCSRRYRRRSATPRRAGFRRCSMRALRYPAQLGGAAGTLAAFGDRGLEIRTRFAGELGLDDARVPWHADRAPVAEIAFALAAAATACGKVGLDVVLLAQTEVGEVREGSGGGSSTMPHKRNPVQAVLARACARSVHAQTALLVSGEHEHERAAGTWQAEWNALSEALAFACGAAAAARASLAGLEVDAERMRANMTDDVYAEARAFGIDGDYLGVADTLVDRVLERWRA